MPLSDDFLISSLQSKYIKFLIFLKDYPEFKHKQLVYFDHKEYVTPKTLDYINEIHTSKSVIIRTTPKEKKTIQDEINAAMSHPRYSTYMNKTKKFIRMKLKTKKISNHVRICNTGLIVYINPEKIQPMLTSIYKKCMDHKQPECQIYWAVFSQKYASQIKKISWTHLKNKRFVPLK